MAIKEKIVQPPPITFPAEEVLTVLQAELINAIESVLEIDGVKIPEDKVEACKLPVEIDSLTCVNILCALEPIINIKLAEEIVRAGG